MTSVGFKSFSIETSIALVPFGKTLTVSVNPLTRRIGSKYPTSHPIMPYDSDFDYHLSYANVDGEDYDGEYVYDTGSGQIAAPAFTQSFGQHSVEAPLTSSNIQPSWTQPSEPTAGVSLNQQAGKRKAESTTAEQPPAKRQELNMLGTRATSASTSYDDSITKDVPFQPAAVSRSNSHRSQTIPKPLSPGEARQAAPPDATDSRQVIGTPVGTERLPAATVFPIQVGTELFKLSGVSISSDGG